MKKSQNQQPATSHRIEPLAEPFETQTSRSKQQNRRQHGPLVPTVDGGVSSRDESFSATMTGALSPAAASLLGSMGGTAAAAAAAVAGVVKLSETAGLARGASGEVVSTDFAVQASLPGVAPPPDQGMVPTLQDSQPASSEELIERVLSERDEQILKVATTVFASRGYRSTDVQEIADLLDIGKATIYRAFGTKEELFFATVDHGMRKLSTRMAKTCDQTSETSASSMEEGIRVFLSFFQENPELVELLMQERSEFRDRDSHSYVRHWRRNAPRWKERIEKSISGGRFRANLKAEELIEATSSLCYGTIFTNYFSNRTVNLESTAKALVDIIMFGVLSDSERQIRKPEETPSNG